MNRTFGQQKAPLLLALGLVVITGISFLWLAQKKPVISDPIGYIYAAEGLATGRGLAYEDANNQYGPGYFSLYAFQIQHPNDLRMFLGFPPGFSLLLAAFMVVTGESSTLYYAVPLLAAISLLVTFALGKLLLGDSWGGFWTALLVMTAVTYWEFATAAWSEVPAMLFVTGGFVVYLWADQKSPSSRRIPLWVMAAMLFTFSLFIRYSNITFIIAPVLFELLTAPRRLWQERDRWLFYAVSGLGILTLPLFNHYYYGGATLTSYSPVHGWYPSPPFSLAYALGSSFVSGYSLIEMGKSLWRNYPFILLVVPVGWWLMRRRYGLLVAFVTVAGVFPYAIYAFAPTGLNARFLIPVFPFLAVSMAVVVTFAGKHIKITAIRWVVGVGLLLLLLWPLPAQIKALETRNQADQNNVSHLQQMVDFAPNNAVFLSYSLNDLIAVYGQKSVLNYRRITPSDPVAERFQFEWYEPCLAITVDQLLEAGIPTYYVEESPQSGWNPEEILKTYFELEPHGQSPTIYQVQQIGSLDTTLICPPQ